MSQDYGLGAMTGILPTMVVAGVASGMMRTWMEPPKKASGRKKPRRSSRRLHSFGDFRNVNL